MTYWQTNTELDYIWLIHGLLSIFLQADRWISMKQEIFAPKKLGPWTHALYLFCK